MILISQEANYLMTIDQVVLHNNYSAGKSDYLKSH